VKRSFGASKKNRSFGSVMGMQVSTEKANLKGMASCSKIILDRKSFLFT